MDPKRPEPSGKHHELYEKRKELHGKRRKLHEKLSEVCEDFVMGEMTRQHKQGALVGELQYLLDFYRDDATWEGIQ
jgi:hypothetical protein